MLHTGHELSTIARLSGLWDPWRRCWCLTSAPAVLQHLLLSSGHIMHTQVCGCLISCTSVMYLAPSGFFGLAHVASIFRSAFDHSFSFSGRFIHGSGWWYGSRTHLMSSRSVSMAAVATLRGACHCLLLLLHSFASGLRRSFNKNKSVGSHWTSSSAIASVVLSPPENLLLPINNPLPMRIRTL